MKIPEKDLSENFTFLEDAHYYFKLHGDLNSPGFFFSLSFLLCSWLTSHHRTNN